MKRLSGLLGMMVVLSAGCTEPPPELAPVWRWEIEPLATVRSMVRLDDGGAVLTLWGSYWSVVRLGADGVVRWTVSLPVPDVLTNGPSVAVTGDGTFVAVYPTSNTPDNEPSCRAIRLDDTGSELSAFDYAYGCLDVVGAPDGGFIIGTGRRQAGEPLEPHDIVSLGPDGAIRWAVALGDCRFVSVQAADGGQLFAGMYIQDCDPDGQPILGTTRPWLGSLEISSGELTWEHQGDIAGSFKHTTHVAPLASIVVALESDLEEATRLRGVYRTDGTEPWRIESAGRLFRRIGAVDGAHVVAGGVEDGVPMLWMYDEGGDAVGAWIVDRYFGPIAPLAAAGDRSVLVFSATEDLSQVSVDRYQLPP